jgi:hypothetical protein
MKTMGLLRDRFKTYWNKNKHEGILYFILSDINLISS